MSISVKNVLCHRSANTVIAKQVWPWELPVLEAQFGEGRVTIRDEDTVIDRELPDAESEYRRLGMAYGLGSKGMSHVEEAYGPGKRGVRALEKEIKDSKSRPAPAVPKKAKAEKDKVSVSADG